MVAKSGLSRWDKQRISATEMRFLRKMVEYTSLDRKINKSTQLNSMYFCYKKCLRIAYRSKSRDLVERMGEGKFPEWALKYAYGGKRDP